MAKRVVLKKGDIVSITRDNHKRYIQYVDNDYYQLNGDVICVFKKIYSSIDNPSVEEIIDDTYDLVLHTFLRRGKMFWAVLSELLTAAGLLTGLALGFALEDLTVPVMLLAGVSLLPFLRKERCDEL